jgi:hypothetical protein
MNSLRRRFFHAVFFSKHAAGRLSNAVLRKIRLMDFYQRRHFIEKFPNPEKMWPEGPRVLAYIAHVVDPRHAQDPMYAADRTERLARTIEALVGSFGHCRLSLAVATIPGRHVVHLLPEYQRRAVMLHEFAGCDPMYVGFRIHDEFEKRIDEADWFLYIEDDILIQDAWFLPRIEAFNRRACDPKALLIPNRYELYEGAKYYIDLTIDQSVAWGRISAFEVDGIQFAECSNPHGGLFMLTREQVQLWTASGRTFRDWDLAGPLESAATFALCESFRLFKPAPRNCNYLEVRHFDTKYSKAYDGRSPYVQRPLQSGSS